MKEEKIDEEFITEIEEIGKTIDYNHDTAKLIQDILLNSRNYSEDKWESIYKNREIPWRKNKLLQEAMMMSPTIPKEYCETILANPACPVSVYKAALSNEHMDNININTAIEKTGKNTITSMLENKELSQAAVNKIAKRTLGKMMYDIESPIEKYEMLALGQTNTDFLVDKLLDQIEYQDDYQNEELMTLIANNTQLSEKSRNRAFDFGASPYHLQNPTRYAEEIVFESLGYAMNDESLGTPERKTAERYLAKRLKNWEVDPDLEKQLFTTLKDSIGTTDIMQNIARQTKSEDVMKMCLDQYESTKRTSSYAYSYVMPFIFENPNFDYSKMCKTAEDMTKTIGTRKVTSKIKGRILDTMNKGLAKRFETNWKDAVFSEDTYRAFINRNVLRTGQQGLLMILASAKNVPDKFLNKLQEFVPDNKTEGHESDIVAYKTVSLLHSQLKLNDFPFEIDNTSISGLLSSFGNVIRDDSAVAETEFNEKLIDFINLPNFDKEMPCFIHALNETKCRLSLCHVDKNQEMKTWAEYASKLLDFTIQKTQDFLKIKNVVNKDISEYEKTDINTMKHVLEGSLENIKHANNPMIMTLNILDMQEKYQELLNKEKVTTISKDMVDEILSDECVSSVSKPISKQKEKQNPEIDIMEI